MESLLIQMLEDASSEGICYCPHCGESMEPDAPECPECGLQNPLITFGCI